MCLQVIIEGFLSYKDQLIADPFSPKINVVGEGRLLLAADMSGPGQCSKANPVLIVIAVGANGSGKSNFFKGKCFEIELISSTGWCVEVDSFPGACSHSVCTQRCLCWSGA